MKGALRMKELNNEELMVIDGGSIYTSPAHLPLICFSPALINAILNYQP